MAHEQAGAALPPLPTGRMQGRQLFSDLVRQAIETAAAQAWSPLVLSDADFEDWPLGDRAVVQALQDWAAQGRRIRFLARDFQKLRERHPRLVTWRVQWSHLVEAHVWTSAGEGEMPSACITSQTQHSRSIRRLRMRRRVSSDSARIALTVSRSSVSRRVCAYMPIG